MATVRPACRSRNALLADSGGVAVLATLLAVRLCGPAGVVKAKPFQAVHVREPRPCRPSNQIWVVGDVQGFQMKQAAQIRQLAFQISVGQVEGGDVHPKRRGNGAVWHFAFAGELSVAR